MKVRFTPRATTPRQTRLSLQTETLHVRRIYSMRAKLERCRFESGQGLHRGPVVQRLAQFNTSG